MPDFEKLYFKLFAAVADAVAKLEAQDFGTAKDILIRAQQDAEARYVEQK